MNHPVPVLEQEQVPAHSGTRLNILPGAIPCLRVDVLAPSAGATVTLHDGGGRTQFIAFLLEGRGEAESAGHRTRLEERSVYAAHPEQRSIFRAEVASRILLLSMELRDEDAGSVAAMSYPLVRAYSECEKYRDYFKSAKTVSRTLVAPFTLPRFCMGSVETRGVDRIEPHSHAMLDQFFFSFPENRCTLLIDNERVPYGGDTLLHIPLGSTHGVDSAGDDVVHYLWIDYFERAAGMEYLVQVHKPVP